MVLQTLWMTAPVSSGKVKQAIQLDEKGQSHHIISSVIVARVSDALIKPFLDGYHGVSKTQL